MAEDNPFISTEKKKKYPSFNLWLQIEEEHEEDRYEDVGMPVKVGIFASQKEAEVIMEALSSMYETESLDGDKDDGRRKE
jgi:hypothetical protein